MKVQLEKKKGKVIDLNKYTTEELEKNQALYEKNRSGNLTTYFAMLGDSFSNQINLLSQLIAAAHEPSLGSYKEKLLKKILRNFLPKRYEIASGFVLFPTIQLSSVKDTDKKIDDKHEISKQLDIIVFDSQEYPVIFRDDDFVVVRPESVHSIIEVTGALTQQKTESSIDLFIDYSRKWKKCREFYNDSGLPKIPIPQMILMSWGVAYEKGYSKTDGGKLRKKIVKIYKEKVSEDDLPGFPLLKTAYIYNDCSVAACIWVEDDITFGYATRNGKLIAYENDQPKETGDGTIASLLADVYLSLNSPFNFILSYVNQTNDASVLRHKHDGFEMWLDNEKSGLISDKHFD